MKLLLLSLETSKQNWFSEVSESYQKKISHYIPFEAVRIRSKGRERDARDQKVKEEGAAILERLDSSDYVILCDERGRAFDTKTLERKLVALMDSGKKRLVFVIGGAYGVSEEVKKRADLCLSLSSLTMNHFVAQVVALEQIYRVLTIWKGVPYHNE